MVPLSQLISGYASASELARLDLIEASNASVLSTADAMFATAYRPWLLSSSTSF